MPRRIESPANPIIVRARSLRDCRRRRWTERVFLVEGPRFIADFMASGLEPDALLLGDGLAPSSMLRCKDHIEVADRALIAISATEHSRTPPLRALFDDPSVRKATPFADDLRTAIENGAVRPRTPVYPIVSQAIYKNITAALSGKVSPEDALKKADDEINKALRTF